MDINYSEILCDDDDEEDFGSEELSTLRNSKKDLDYYGDFFNNEIFSTLSWDRE